MSEKRFTIKPQDDYWAVVDNYNEDKVCIINGIHTEIEAIWLCDFMSEQQSKQSIIDEQKIAIDEMITDYKNLKKENEQLQKENFFLAYWKRKAMTLLMQVRRLTPRMTDEEVMEFSKELDDE